MILWRQIARELETATRQSNKDIPMKLSRKYPLTRRAGVTQLPCDVAFKRAVEAHKKTSDSLRSTSSVCLFNTGKSLLSSIHHFDHSDADLSAFESAFTSGLAERDLTTMGRSCRTFLSHIDRNTVNWADEQAADVALISAVDNFSNALEHWAMSDYVSAHSYTVMARSSLTKFGD